MPLLKQRGILVRLDQYYTSVMRIMGIGNDVFGQPLQQNEAQEIYSKKILGQRLIHAAPQSWVDMETVLAAEKMPHEFYDAPIESRARWRAAQMIQGMIRVIERHKDEQDRTKAKK